MGKEGKDKRKQQKVEKKRGEIRKRGETGSGRGKRKRKEDS